MRFAPYIRDASVFACQRIAAQPRCHEHKTLFISVMKYPKILAVSAAALSALAGCTSVNESEAHKAPQIENIDGQYKRVLVTNYGYYLFNWIPLASGGEGDGSFDMFSDNVNVEDAMKTLNSECEKLGSTELADLQIQNTSTCFFKWSPFFGSTFGIYWYKEVQVSATINTGVEKPAIETGKEGGK